MRELPQQDNLDIARLLAIEHLRSLDPSKQADRSGAEFIATGTNVNGDAIGADPGGSMVLAFLGSTVMVALPGWTVTGPGGSEVPLREQVLLLHYIEGTKPVQPVSTQVTFTEVPAGEFYLAAFERRAKKPLLGVFGQEPELVLEAASCMGGARDGSAGGDVAVCIRALPRIDVTLVFWKGDDEFPPDLSILFSGNVASFLSTEDIAVLTGMIAVRLMKGVKR